VTGVRLAERLLAWQGRRVFLTGHTGFKGAWMVGLLHLLGAKVTGFALPGPVSSPDLFTAGRFAGLCEDLRGDVRDLMALSQAMAAAQPDVVIHMAAQALVRPAYLDPVCAFSTNVMGTVHVLEAARSVPSLKAVLIVTSDKCYENPGRLAPFREDEPMGGADPYSASKGAAELVTASYARSFLMPKGVRVATVRAGNVIGGGDWSADRLIPDLVRAMATGVPALIRHPASIRPWQHVLDALIGYLLAAEHLLQSDRLLDRWNFGPNPGEEATVGEVARLFARITGCAVEMGAGAGDGKFEPAILRVDNAKAKIELGWRSLFSVDSAVESAANWHKAFAEGVPAGDLVLQDIRGRIVSPMTERGR
jgi:CDP-glucose 4,6-dehydratase